MDKALFFRFRIIVQEIKVTSMSMLTPTPTLIPALAPLFSLYPFVEDEEGVRVDKEVSLFEFIWFVGLEVEDAGDCTFQPTIAAASAVMSDTTVVCLYVVDEGVSSTKIP